MPVTVEVRHGQAVAVVNLVDQHVRLPRSLDPFVHHERTYAVADHQNDFRPSAFLQLSRPRAREVIAAVSLVGTEAVSTKMLEPESAAHDVGPSVTVDVRQRQSFMLVDPLEWR